MTFFCLSSNEKCSDLILLSQHSWIQSVFPLCSVRRSPCLCSNGCCTMFFFSIIGSFMRLTSPGCLQQECVCVPLCTCRSTLLYKSLYKYPLYQGHGCVNSWSATQDSLYLLTRMMFKFAYFYYAIKITLLGM